MSEFEKELENVKYSDFDLRESKCYSCYELIEYFKDWQSPKPLVVVPQIVADFIKVLKIKGIKPLMDSATFGEIGFTEEKRDEILHWINEHQEEYMRAWIDGYTVEKEKKYVLKHIDLSELYVFTSVYLAHGRYTDIRHEEYSKDVDMSKIEQCHFTQSEIDKLNIGSYEQIPVEMSDNEI